MAKNRNPVEKRLRSVESMAMLQSILLPRTEDVGGCVFMGSDYFLPECHRRQFSGLPDYCRDSVRAIRPGVVEATNFGSFNIDPSAWPDINYPGRSFYHAQAAEYSGGYNINVEPKTHIQGRSFSPSQDAAEFCYTLSSSVGGSGGGIWLKSNGGGAAAGGGGGNGSGSGGSGAGGNNHGNGGGGGGGSDDSGGDEPYHMFMGREHAEVMQKMRLYLSLVTAKRQMLEKMEYWQNAHALRKEHELQLLHRHLKYVETQLDFLYQDLF